MKLIKKYRKLEKTAEYYCDFFSGMAESLAEYKEDVDSFGDYGMGSDIEILQENIKLLNEISANFLDIHSNCCSRLYAIKTHFGEDK